MSVNEIVSNLYTHVLCRAVAKVFSWSGMAKDDLLIYVY